MLQHETSTKPRTSPSARSEERLRLIIEQCHERNVQTIAALADAYAEGVKRKFDWIDEAMKRTPFGQTKMKQALLAVASGELLAETVYEIGCNLNYLEQFKRLSIAAQSDVFVDKTPIKIVRGDKTVTIKDPLLDLEFTELALVIDPVGKKIRSISEQKAWLAKASTVNGNGADETGTHASTGGIKAYIRVGMTVEDERLIAQAAEMCGMSKYDFVLDTAIAAARKALAACKGKKRG